MLTDHFEQRSIIRRGWSDQHNLPLRQIVVDELQILLWLILALALRSLLRQRHFEAYVLYVFTKRDINTRVGCLS